jgi:hypothetical protein
MAIFQMIWRHLCSRRFCDALFAEARGVRAHIVEINQRYQSAAIVNLSESGFLLLQPVAHSLEGESLP